MAIHGRDESVAEIDMSIKGLRAMSDLEYIKKIDDLCIHEACNWQYVHEVMRIFAPFMTYFSPSGALNWLHREICKAYDAGNLADRSG